MAMPNKLSIYHLECDTRERYIKEVILVDQEMDSHHHEQRQGVTLP